MTKNKNRKVAVIGIGRVGLPLALFLAAEGFTVYGLGRSNEKIQSLEKGEMPFVEKGAQPVLKAQLGKRFFPTTDYAVIKDCDYLILTLGTPIDENMNPVYEQIDAALKAATKYLHSGQTLILRSTVSPETTAYVKAYLNDLPGITVGENFYLAFCPERIAEGYALEETKSLPQIVGGVDPASTKKAAWLFEAIGAPVMTTDAVSAELAKLFTNMYRYITFAIANEFMIIAENYQRDIYEIVNLVNRNYKRGGLALPGLTSGPCLFKDGFFLIADFPFNDLISTSWKINESIPLFLVKNIKARMVLAGKKAVILGLAFKPEIDDIRESLSFKVRKAFLRERAQVVLHDPFAVDYHRQKIEKDLYRALQGADLIFIGTRHKVYLDIDRQRLKKLVRPDCLICDIWNVFQTDKIIFSLKDLP